MICFRYNFSRQEKYIFQPQPKNITFRKQYRQMIYTKCIDAIDRTDKTRNTLNECELLYKTIRKWRHDVLDGGGSNHQRTSQTFCLIRIFILVRRPPFKVGLVKVEELSRRFFCSLFAIRRERSKCPPSAGISPCILTLAPVHTFQRS